MNHQNFEKKWVDAYNKMMERLHHIREDAEEQTLPNIQRQIDAAKRHAVELKELTVDEAEMVAAYLRRDLHDAANYLENTGKELSSWLTFDLQLVEERLWDWFTSVADKTRLELSQLTADSPVTKPYHSGDITTIGSLICLGCGEQLDFKETRLIPPCPRCGHTLYQRKDY